MEMALGPPDPFQIQVSEITVDTEQIVLIKSWYCFDTHSTRDFPKVFIHVPEINWRAIFALNVHFTKLPKNCTSPVILEG